ncbi:ECF transporter S component [Lacticaseibacillus zhaodongensis]|uniref:ECF transporter S component n=1 Tax=Lacticaseibacillus zhaodongensis TaxID=2668065 RepID=UPI0012D3449D|nr:ECF transporter S component [Lacticaseibacillus zhaodongensis]
MHKRSSAYNISVMGILTALLLLQAFVPMFGYIRITPGVAITTMHLTVIMGAVVLGTRSGATLGLIWGVISMTVAYVAPGDPLSLLLFRNPVIAIVPRVLCGLIAGLVFNQLGKGIGSGKYTTAKMVAAGISGALTNTLFVIGFTWLFYAQRAASIVGNGANSQNLGFVLIAMLGVNAVAEAIAAGIITPLLGRALLRFRR